MPKPPAKRGRPARKPEPDAPKAKPAKAKRPKKTVAELKAAGVIKRGVDLAAAGADATATVTMRGGVISRVDVQFGPTPRAPGSMLKKPAAPKGGGK